jgi:hypothetical protein
MSINPTTDQAPTVKAPASFIPAIGGFFLRLLKAIFIRKKDCCK